MGRVSTATRQYNKNTTLALSNKRMAQAAEFRPLAEPFVTNLSIYVVDFAAVGDRRSNVE